MRHRIGIVLAVIMTGVLFFPGAWGYLRLLRLPAPADQLFADDEFTTLEPELEDQPTTQLTPIRATTLAPIPAAPWHDASPPGVP